MKGFEKKVSMVYIKIMQNVNNKVKMNVKDVYGEVEGFTVKILIRSLH